eukprot:gene10332-1869_t
MTLIPTPSDTCLRPGKKVLAGADAIPTRPTSSPDKAQERVNHWQQREHAKACQQTGVTAYDGEPAAGRQYWGPGRCLSLYASWACQALCLCFLIAMPMPAVTCSSVMSLSTLSGASSYAFVGQDLDLHVIKASPKLQKPVMGLAAPKALPASNSEFSEYGYFISTCMPAHSPALRVKDPTVDLQSPVLGMPVMSHSESQPGACLLTVEQFGNAAANGPLLDFDWRCRKCSKRVEDHPTRPILAGSCSDMQTVPTVSTAALIQGVVVARAGVTAGAPASLPADELTSDAIDGHPPATIRPGFVDPTKLPQKHAAFIPAVPGARSSLNGPSFPPLPMSPIFT